MLTDKNLLLERPHPVGMVGGVQRIYRFSDGNGVSVVNGPMLHHYPFAWEVAIISEVKDNGNRGDILYDTPLTDDVEVFQTDDETNEFIERARQHFEGAAAQAGGHDEGQRED